MKTKKKMRMEKTLTYKEFGLELMTGKRKPSAKAKSLSLIDQYYYYLTISRNKK